jgi:hypothetical protein
MRKRKVKVSAEQEDLFQRAKRERDDALEDVHDAAAPSWTAQAMRALIRTAETLQEFISDDVWRVGALEPTRENRALGPIFLSAAKEGWITKTDRVRASVRSHLSGKPVWRSLIYKGRG